jgi:tape measure domain-containing protein
MSIAALGYEIDSSQAVKAGRDLDAMNQAAGRAGAGADQLERRSDAVAGAMRRLASVAGVVAGAIAAAFSVRAMVQAADTWTDLTSRVQLAIGASEDARDVMSQIEAMARRTYSSLQQTTEGWLANATAMRELGMTTQQSLAFQEAMNNALVVSGARAERAASVQNALARAMAAGRLTGDQLNTVIQTGGRVAELLAAELGTTVSGLRAMGQQGLITSDVIQRALLGNLQMLREEAESMPATIGDAMVLVGNSFLGLVGFLDEVTGASSIVAESIIFVADNLQLFASYAAAAGIAVAVTYTPAIIAATASTVAWVASLITLRGALIATGIGAFVVAAGTALNFILRLRQATGSWGEAFGLIGDVVREVFDRIRLRAAALSASLEAIGQEVRATYTGILSTIYTALGTAAAAVGSGIEGVVNAVISALETMVNLAIQGINTIIDGINRIPGVEISLIGDFDAGRVSFADSIRGAFDQVSQSLTETQAVARQTAADFRAVSQEANALAARPLESITAIRDALAGAGAETEETAAAVRALTAALGSGGGGGGGGAGDDTGLLSRFEALRDELRTQTEQVELWYAEAQETLQWALENERITLEEHAQMRLEIERLYQEQLAAIRSQSQAQQLGDTADFFGAMAEVAQQGGERMTRVARAFGAAQALINTYLAASQTLADPSLGFFAKLAAVAKVVAAGMGLVNAIRSGGSAGRDGGGGGGGDALGARGVAGVTETQRPLRRTIIELRGPDWVRNIIQPVMEQIYNATKDGERVIFQ